MVMQLDITNGVTSTHAPRIGKTAVILQSSYIPWKGYFDLIRQADIFVLYDDMQYTRRDWRNRNLIKTPQGLQWLTIPVKSKGNYHEAIEHIEVSTRDWAERHWQSLSNVYRRAPHFTAQAGLLQPLYETAAGMTHLSQINYLFLTAICRQLGITTPFCWSSEFGRVAGRTENLLHVCQAVGASEYLSGPSARSYIETARFAEAGIGLRYIDYRGYPPYTQLHGEFQHGVSIIDLLLNTGPEASRYLDKETPRA